MSPRLFIRSLYKITVFDNPVFFLFQHIKGGVCLWKSYPQQTKKISADLEKNKLKLIKAKNIISINTEKDRKANFFMKF